MKKDRGLALLGVVSAGLCLSAVVWYTYFRVCMAFFNDWQTRQAFGEMFGALESLFSALALFMVIATCLLQYRALRAQYAGIRQTTEMQLQNSQRQMAGQRLQAVSVLLHVEFQNLQQFTSAEGSTEARRECLKRIERLRREADALLD